MQQSQSKLNLVHDDATDESSYKALPSPPLQPYASVSASMRPPVVDPFSLSPIMNRQLGSQQSSLQQRRESLPSIGSVIAQIERQEEAQAQAQAAAPGSGVFYSPAMKPMPHHHAYYEQQPYGKQPIYNMLTSYSMQQVSEASMDPIPLPSQVPQQQLVLPAKKRDSITSTTSSVESAAAVSTSSVDNYEAETRSQVSRFSRSKSTVGLLGQKKQVQTDQPLCCVKNCQNAPTNRLRFSLRMISLSDYKPDYLDRSWNNVCSYHYFNNLYKWKQSLKRKNSTASDDKEQMVSPPAGLSPQHKASQQPSVSPLSLGQGQVQQPAVEQASRTATALDARKAPPPLVIRKRPREEFDPVSATTVGTQYSSLEVPSKIQRQTTVGLPWLPAAASSAAAMPYPFPGATQHTVLMQGSVLPSHYMSSIPHFPTYSNYSTMTQAADQSARRQSLI